MKIKELIEIVIEAVHGAIKERNTPGPDYLQSLFRQCRNRDKIRITIVLKSPRRSTNAKTDKLNVKRNENAVVHHETGLANQLLICAMQRHSLGGTYSDKKHHL